MPTKWLVMTASAGAILAFVSSANAMTNTMPAGLAMIKPINSSKQDRFVVRIDAGGGRTTTGSTVPIQAGVGQRGANFLRAVIQARLRRWGW